MAVLRARAMTFDPSRLCCVLFITLRYFSKPIPDNWLMFGPWQLPQDELRFGSFECEDLLLDLGAICSQELDRVRNLLRREVVSDLRGGAVMSRVQFRSVQADVTTSSTTARVAIFGISIVCLYGSNLRPKLVFHDPALR